MAKFDRLSRSLVDFAGLLVEAQTRGFNIVALDLGVDLSTPAGEFLASVMASAAQWERRIIGQRTKDALAIRKEQGAKLGRPALPRDALGRRVTSLCHAGAVRFVAVARHIATLTATVQKRSAGMAKTPVSDRGADKIIARDGQRDTIRCGPGKDTVTADKNDTASPETHVFSTG